MKEAILTSMVLCSVQRHIRFRNPISNNHIDGIMVVVFDSISKKLSPILG
jgi:hypothetical protein